MLDLRVIACQCKVQLSFTKMFLKLQYLNFKTVKIKVLIHFYNEL